MVLELIKELVKTFGGCRRTSYLKPIREKIKQDKTTQILPKRSTKPRNKVIELRFGLVSGDPVPYYNLAFKVSNFFLNKTDVVVHFLT